MSWITVLENLTLPFVLLLWPLVVIRTHGAIYGGSRRLAGILLLLVTILTIRLSFVGPFIDQFTGIIGLQVIVRDSLGILMAASAALAVSDVVQKATGRRYRRVGVLLIIFSTVVMIVSFSMTGNNRDGITHMGAASGNPAQLTYWLAYTIAYGTFITTIVIFVATEVLNGGGWTRGKIGLLYFGIGAMFTDLYLTAKVVVLYAAAVDQYQHTFVRYAASVQAVPSALAIAFIVLGAASWTRLDLRKRWLHFRLLRPWRELTENVPSVVLIPPLRNPSEKLNRRVHEIREAAALLSRYLTLDDVALVDSRLHADARTRTRELLYLAKCKATTSEGSQEPIVRLTLPDSASDVLLSVGRSFLDIDPFVRRFARLVTEVLAPPCIGAATLLSLGWNSNGWQGLYWGLVAAIFVTVIPYAVVIVGVKIGRWKDRMLTTRRQRIVPIISNIGFAVIGLVITVSAPNAPREIPAFIGAAIGTQALLFLINLTWKISFHAGVSAGMSAILAMTFGTRILFILIPLVVLICWARVRLREHTVAQVVVGVPVGGVALGVIYDLALRWSTIL